MDKRYLVIFYHIVMAFFAIVSICLIIADYGGVINLEYRPYSVIDGSILSIFIIDYFARFIASNDKKQFVKSNFWDLLSIIPVNQIFAIFRVARVARLARALRLIRLVRLVGLTGRLNKFFKTNGLNYYIYMSLVILLISSSLFYISEKVSFLTAVWWSITTATTVGYGDVSPTTGVGKLAAVLLMLVGIGFVGMLTSAITGFFTRNVPDELQEKLEELHQENRRLQSQLDRIESLMNSHTPKNDQY